MQKIQTTKKLSEFVICGIINTCCQKFQYPSKLSATLKRSINYLNTKIAIYDVFSNSLGVMIAVKLVNAAFKQPASGLTTTGLLLFYDSSDINP
jgi:hypothetical protein